MSGCSTARRPDMEPSLPSLPPSHPAVTFDYSDTERRIMSYLVNHGYHSDLSPEEAQKIFDEFNSRFPLVQTHLASIRTKVQGLDYQVVSPTGRRQRFDMEKE